MLSIEGWPSLIWQKWRQSLLLSGIYLAPRLIRQRGHVDTACGTMWNVEMR